ncbi:hypothetical protein MSAN_01753400 [Mycena sanguinolenta]|uniref:Uncharacterized protein n=1 Tax=Mycena sanguinolenta TaxID=230812 RepID=A0A8H7CTT9_9AGAR|nr:hypothetical protein MSAN_01753400 [Mycena sanguinolenta]
MFHSFTTVDMRHLKSLCIYQSPLTRFLRENSRSLRNLKMGSSCGSISWSSDTPDPQIMAGQNSLNCIEFEVDKLHAILTFVSLLGDLRNLTALKIVKITFQHRLYREDIIEDAEWDRLDEVLQSLPTGVPVDVCAAFDRHVTVMDGPDVDAIKNRLPRLANRGTLHVYQNPRTNIRFNVQSVEH